VTPGTGRRPREDSGQMTALDASMLIAPDRGFATTPSARLDGVRGALCMPPLRASGLDANAPMKESQAEERKDNIEGEDDGEGDAKRNVAHTVEPVAKTVDHVKHWVSQ